MSGVTPNQAFKDAFGRIKSKERKWFISNITGGETAIESEAEGGTYADFVRDLTGSGEPRFAVFDWEERKDDGQFKSKMFFFAWIPASCSIMVKIPYSSSVNNMQAACPHTIHVNADTMADLDEDKIAAMV